MKSNIFLYGLSIMWVLLLTGCDTTSIDEIFDGIPTIETFFPTEGSIGTEITVKGSNLDDVVSASIGEVQAELVEKVSDTQLKIRVSGHAQSGKIALKNSLGTAESDTIFTVTYPAPSVLNQSIPDEVEMGNKLLINGSHMNVISKALFTAEGQTSGHEAEVISLSDNEIVVKVPYVESDKATLTFSYFNGTEQATTEPIKKFVIKRYQPVISTVEFPQVAVGDMFTLKGSYLNKINELKIAGVSCVITSQTENSLQFVVPTSDTFKDGLNYLPLTMIYFEGVESKVITEAFKVYVPYLYTWKDVKIWGQGRDVENLTSFFSPETGIAYANSAWRELDAVSFKYQDATCSAKNVPAVTESEYNSVVPYFFFSGASAGTLQLNSPAGSNSQLRNFYMINNSADQYRVTGAKANCYGTPCLSFVYLDPSKSANNELIGKIKSGSLQTIDEHNFPIDVSGKKVGGIDISGARQSVNNSIFAPGIFSVGTNKNADIDAYIMVIYYDYRGQSTNPAEHIRRIGFIHIKNIDFRLYNNTKAPSSSSVTFDMYWMKHNYK